MIGQPKYERFDIVRFKFGPTDELQGFVEIVDAYGTFEQSEEPSYDILIAEKEGRGLYKHIRESRIIEKIGRQDPDKINY